MNKLSFSEQLAEIIEDYEDDVIFHSRQRAYATKVHSELEQILFSLLSTATQQQKIENVAELEKLEDLRHQAQRLLFSD